MHDGAVEFSSKRISSSCFNSCVHCDGEGSRETQVLDTQQGTCASAAKLLGEVGGNRPISEPSSAPGPERTRQKPRAPANDGRNFAED